MGKHVRHPEVTLVATRAYDGVDITLRAESQVVRLLVTNEDRAKVVLTEIRNQADEQLRAIWGRDTVYGEHEAVTPDRESCICASGPGCLGDPEDDEPGAHDCVACMLLPAGADCLREKEWRA